jgi:hypothetical protein
MKPGDLVKLVLPASARWARSTTQVPVVWNLDGWGVLGVDGAPTATSFPEGTAAVFLSPAPADDEDEDGAVLLDTRILIEGRVGWVWSRYLEVV